MSVANKSLVDDLIFLINETYGDKVPQTEVITETDKEVMLNITSAIIKAAELYLPAQ